MPWFRSKPNEEALKRDSRAPLIAKHGNVVTSGYFYKQGREYTTWTYRRFDLHENHVICYYDPVTQIFKGEIDFSEVIITHGADSMNYVATAKKGNVTGSEMPLDCFAPNHIDDKSNKAIYRRFNMRSTNDATVSGRTLRIIMDTPQDAALLCSSLAALDPDGMSNAQDFAAVQGWMMPRRTSLHNVDEGLSDSFEKNSISSDDNDNNNNDESDNDHENDDDEDKINLDVEGTEDDDKIYSYGNKLSTDSSNNSESRNSENNSHEDPSSSLTPAARRKSIEVIEYDKVPRRPSLLLVVPDTQHEKMEENTSSNVNVLNKLFPTVELEHPTEDKKNNDNNDNNSNNRNTNVGRERRKSITPAKRKLSFLSSVWTRFAPNRSNAQSPESNMSMGVVYVLIGTVSSQFWQPRIYEFTKGCLFRLQDDENSNVFITIDIENISVSIDTASAKLNGKMKTRLVGSSENVNALNLPVFKLSLKNNDCIHITFVPERLLLTNYFCSTHTTLSPTSRMQIQVDAITEAQRFLKILKVVSKAFTLVEIICDIQENRVALIKELTKMETLHSEIKVGGFTGLLSAIWYMCMIYSILTSISGSNVSYTILIGTSGAWIFASMTGTHIPRNHSILHESYRLVQLGKGEGVFV
jgi:hypothetical protein